jgi:hypothetical protein
MTDQSNQTPKATEQLEVAAKDVVGRVQNLIEQGNVRRLILRDKDARVLLDIPLTAGVVVGGALTVANPILMLITGAIAAYTRVTIEVVRDGDAPVEEKSKH